MPREVQQQVTTTVPRCVDVNDGIDANIGQTGRPVRRIDNSATIVFLLQQPRLESDTWPRYFGDSISFMNTSI
jgi:hypothetical protein